ncbi:thermonuclease family protein [Marinomonas aquimarina]|nr:thermonuclease family protein [Marinomonas aquimarina]
MAMVIGSLVVALPLFADTNAKVARINSVYDADTFRVDISNWPDIVGKNIPVRVNGVDAAEIRGKCLSEKQQAKAARDYTRRFLESGHTIELRNIQRGKYFRLLADVYVDGASLSEALIASGHARTYHGGTRQGWCAYN